MLKFATTLLRSYSSTSSATDAALITAFIQNFNAKKNINFPGQWESSHAHGCEVGIGRFNQAPAIATRRYHIEIEGDGLACYDKRREQGDSYRYITNPQEKQGVLAAFAQSIRDPGSLKLWSFQMPETISESQPATVVQRKLK